MERGGVSGCLVQCGGMKAVLSRLIFNTGSALWNGTTRVTDSGGGATDVIVVRYV